MASDLPISATAAAAYPPGFMVLHGNRLEDLRALLTQFLQGHPLLPLQAEVILVQSNGMKHWLEMALADDAAMGICAATRMELPSSFLWQTYRQVLGAQAVPHHMPFDKSHLQWRLMRLLPQRVASHPAYAPLRHYLHDVADGEPAGRRLYQLTQQIADVLDGYQSYRSDWLEDWATGRDVLRTPSGTLPLPPTQVWQAQLWRDLRQDVGDALADASRSAVHARFCRQLETMAQAFTRTGQRPAGLPERVVVFGISSLPMQTVEALALLGQMCQVLMLVQNPCQHYWGDLVDGHAQLRVLQRRRQSPKPAQAAPAGHPLLASWGKQGRDYLHLLDEYDRLEQYQARLVRVDAFVDPLSLLRAPHQLAQLQSAVLNLNGMPPEPLPLDASDSSLLFSSSHSAQREVEVLHDKLWAWLEADAALQPRDVMVMVPDMEAFAPHIHAVFGRFERGQSRHIPYSVADATQRTAPMVQALEHILRLPSARISLLDWLGLFEIAAVRKRFALEQADVDQLKDWLQAAGLRWGLDAQHRKAWGVAALDVADDQNTWAFALRRLLLGYAVGAGDTWQGTVPQGALASLDAPLMGSLLAWVDAVSQTLSALSVPQTAASWGVTLGAVVERFFLATDETDERQLQRMLDALETWLQACNEADLVAPMALEVVRDHWLAQMAEAGLHQRFFGGGVQFATLMPMRSIPFKVICLLGMNDGDYPRQTSPRDFDLMAQHWRYGDRSRREDDRYLFLEAMLSARERLYISWQGKKATDNTPRPPSVLVAQLLDHLHTAWSPQREVQVQPLQPYSDAYFLQGSPFQTFDADWERAQQPAGNAVHHGEPLQRATAAPPLALTLDDLRTLLRAPVEVFYRGALQVRFANVQDDVQVDEPFALNALERFQLAQTLLQATDTNEALNRLRFSGQLPLAAFAERERTSLERELLAVQEREKPWREKYPHDCAPLPVVVPLGPQGSGSNLTGTLHGLWSEKPLAVPQQQPKARHSVLQIGRRLGAVLVGPQDRPQARGHLMAGLWLNHLAACAMGLHTQTVLIGLDGQVCIGPMDAADALAHLARLRDIHAQAWHQPLPVACKTAWEYLLATVAIEGDVHSSDAGGNGLPATAWSKVRSEFEGSFQRQGEWQRSAYLQRAFESFDEIAPGLGVWAQALYGPMAQACVATRFGAVATAEEGA